MLKKGMTVSEAAHSWVGEFNAIPRDMIETLMGVKPDDWTEVTKPSVGSRVYVYGEEFGEVKEVTEDGEYLIETDSGEEVTTDIDNIEIDFDDRLPMWGTMWSFGDCCDDHWMEDEDGIKVMSECGFRVFENDEWGYFFGIDGGRI